MKALFFVLFSSILLANIGFGQTQRSYNTYLEQDDPSFIGFKSRLRFSFDQSNPASLNYDSDTITWVFIKQSIFDFVDLSSNFIVNGNTAIYKQPLAASNNVTDRFEVVVNLKAKNNDTTLSNKIYVLNAYVFGTNPTTPGSNDTAITQIFLKKHSDYFVNSSLNFSCAGNPYFPEDTSSNVMNLTLNFIPYPTPSGISSLGLDSSINTYIYLKNAVSLFAPNSKLRLIHSSLPITDTINGQPVWNLGLDYNKNTYIDLKFKYDSIALPDSANFNLNNLIAIVSDSLFQNLDSLINVSQVISWTKIKNASCNFVTNSQSKNSNFTHSILEVGKHITANKPLEINFMSFLKISNQNLRNKVIFIKDPRVTIIDPNYYAYNGPTITDTFAPNHVNGDTIIWDKQLKANYGEALHRGANYGVKLSVNLTPQLQIDDTLIFYSKSIIYSSIFTSDSIIKNDTLKCIIANDELLVIEDTTNTELSAPQGIQWVRANDQLLGSGKGCTISIDSTSIINASPSNFVDYLTKYNIEGKMIWRKQINTFTTLANSTDTIQFSKLINVPNSTNFLYLRHNNFSNKIFCAKFDSAANLIWVNSINIPQNTTLKFADIDFDNIGNFEVLFFNNINEIFTAGVDKNNSTIIKLNISNNGVLVNSFIKPNNDYKHIITAIKKTGSGYVAIEGKLAEKLFFPDISGPFLNFDETIKNLQMIYQQSFIKLNSTLDVIESIEIKGLSQTEFDKIIINTNGSFSIFGTTYSKRMFDYYYNKFPFITNEYYENEGSIGFDGTINYFNNGLHKGITEIQYLHLNSMGDVLISKPFGGSFDDRINDVIQTNDGNFVIAGVSNSVNTGNIKGVHLKNDTVSYVNFNNDTITYIDDQTKSPESWVFKITPNGQLLWQKPIGNSTVIDFDESDGTAFAYNSATNIVSLINNELIVVGSYAKNLSGSSDFYGSGGSYILKLGATNVIRGTVFIDLNNDGIKDSNEVYYDGNIVASKKDSLIASSNINLGNYSNIVDTGTYITKPFLNGYYTVVPPFKTTTFSGYQMADTANFRLVPIPNINDLRITVTPVNIPRPGFVAQYIINYKNVGTTTLSGTVQVVKDSRTNYTSAIIAPNAITGDTLRWNVGSLLPSASGNITLNLTLAAPPTLTNLDSITHTFSINPILGDTTPMDNKIVLNERVRGSFDPNDKTEIHGSQLTPTQVANGEYLVYTIRFQNTGNDTAFRVIITDTLSNLLDWNSFEMISASHSYNLQIVDGNKLSWKFDPILLPDSTTNLLASNGYVSFRIKAKNNLILGQQITNKASIYFDFNLPVVTNTQINTISLPISTLALNWLSFNAIKNNNYVTLKWQTSQERDANRFEIWHSANGIDFVKIGTVAAKNSAINNYNFIHNNPNQGINYYKLIQVDNANQSKQSNIAIVNYAKEIAIGIYPNPASNSIRIDLYNSNFNNSTINIFELSGKKCLQVKVANNGGNVVIDISKLTRGLYYVQIVDNNKIKSIPFEKL